MSILSDRQIRQLSEVPLTKLDTNQFQALQHRLNISETVHFTDPAIPARIAAERRQRLIDECTIPTTQEERDAFRPMIKPFQASCVKEIQTGYERPMGNPPTLVMVPGVRRRVISYGLSSFGYDVRLTDKIKVFTNINSTEIDPKRMDEQGCLTDAQIRHDSQDGSRYVLIPPHTYILGVTHEYFDIPNDVMVVCLGKSTYARSGAIVNVTPIEPGFQGNVVIEIANSTPLPLRIYIDEGIAQFLFYQGSEPCEVSYADRAGKYQGQQGVTLPRV